MRMSRIDKTINFPKQFNSEIKTLKKETTKFDVQLLEDTDLNFLLIDNLYILGHGNINVPLEVVKGKLLVRQNNGITYQKIFIDDIDSLPLVRNNKNGKFSEWTVEDSKKFQQYMVRDKLEELITTTHKNEDLIFQNSKKLDTRIKEIENTLIEMLDDSIKSIDERVNTITDSQQQTYDKIRQELEELKVIDSFTKKEIKKLKDDIDNKDQATIEKNSQLDITVTDLEFEYQALTNKLLNIELAQQSLLKEINDRTSSDESYKKYTEPLQQKQLQQQQDLILLKDDIKSLQNSLDKTLSNIKTKQATLTKRIEKEQVKSIEAIEHLLQEKEEIIVTRINNFMEDFYALKSELEKTIKSKSDFSGYILNVEKRLLKLEKGE